MKQAKSPKFWKYAQNYLILLYSILENLGYHFATICQIYKHCLVYIVSFDGFSNLWHKSKHEIYALLIWVSEFQSHIVSNVDQVTQPWMYGEEARAQITLKESLTPLPFNVAANDFQCMFPTYTKFAFQMIPP